jgi:hypothetical protein
MFFDNYTPAFLWAYFVPDKLENLNEASCNCLTEQGYDDSELQPKLTIQPKSLLSRLPRDGTLEKYAKEYSSEWHLSHFPFL